MRKGFMSRIARNRQLTLIIALMLCLTSASLHPRHALAGGPVMTDPGDINNGNGGNGSGGSGLGDPDVPDGKGGIKHGALSGRGGSLANRAVGDGRYAGGTMIWRLYVAWIGTRGLWFHF